MHTRSRARLLERARAAEGWEVLRLVVQYLRERGHIALLNFDFMRMQYLLVIDHSVHSEGNPEERLRLDNLWVTLGGGSTTWLTEFLDFQRRHRDSVEALTER